MSENNVVEIGTERTFLVRRLEALLESAKSGELQVLIGVTVYDTGKTGFVHCGALASQGDQITAYAAVVGMVSALHHDVDQTLHAMIADEGDEDEYDE
jgi:acyl-coenzyme A thioesterase PaaI-like protein